MSLVDGCKLAKALSVRHSTSQTVKNRAEIQNAATPESKPVITLDHQNSFKKGNNEYDNVAENALINMIMYPCPFNRSVCTNTESSSVDTTSRILSSHQCDALH